MFIPTEYFASVLQANPALTAPVCRLTSTLLTSDSAGLLNQRDLEQAATEFKSNWNSCMDHTVCKWVAIIGIVLASLVLLWIITSIFRCICLGIQCLDALFCCCRNCCTCCCNGNRRKRSGNDSYVAQHQNPTPVINNHYYDTNNRAEPEYLMIHETVPAPTSNAPPSYGWNAPQSGGYQKLNDNTHTVEMNTFNSNGPANSHSSSALYNDTSYNPNQTSSYDNTYNSDYHNMQGVSHGSNSGYYNNRFN